MYVMYVYIKKRVENEKKMGTYTHGHTLICDPHIYRAVWSAVMKIYEKYIKKIYG